MNIEAAIDRYYAYDPRSPDYRPVKRCGNCIYIKQVGKYDYICTHHSNQAGTEIDDPYADSCDEFDKQEANV